MSTLKPIISQVFYQSPLVPIPEDYPFNQFTIFCTNSSANGSVLVGQIMQGNEVVAVDCIQSSDKIVLSPPYPLSEDLPYYAQTQIVLLNGGVFNHDQIIASMNWTSPDTTSFPIIAEMLELKTAMVEILDGQANIQVTCNWSNHNSITGYLQVWSNKSYQVPSFISSSKNSLTLKFPYNNQPPYTAILRSLISLSTPTVWPPNGLPTSVPYCVGTGISYILPTQSPVIKSVSYDGQNVAVVWDPLTIPAGAETVSYELLLTSTNNGVSSTVVLSATQTGGVFPLNEVNSTTNYNVSARINYGVIKGPLSLSVPIITGTASNILTNINTSTPSATLSWLDSSGYNPTQFNGYTEAFNLIFNNGTPVVASATNYNLPTTDFNGDLNTVQIFVSATNPSGVVIKGPISAVATFKFDPLLMIASNGQTTTTPVIYAAPTLANINQQPNPITVYLPAGNYSATGKTFTPPVQYPATSPMFNLQVNTGPNKSSYPYTLNIAPPNWDNNLVRLTLQTNYISFLQAAETANMSSWGIYLLQEAIARYMPQNFVESLYYNYGFCPVTLNGTTQSFNGYVDLRPGMVLRILPSSYNVVPGYDQPNQIPYTDGFINHSPIDYDVNSYFLGTDWNIGFDVFISQLVSNQVLKVFPPPYVQDLPNVGGIGEVADLYYQQNKFYRLFFPTNLLPTIGQGSNLPSAQFSIASANSFTNLQQTNNGTTNNTNTYFLGRSILKICIRVMINGNENLVPLGTTVTNILERVGRVPPHNVTLSKISLQRAMGQSDSSGKLIHEVGSSYKVNFEGQTSTLYGNGQTMLDLPLLHGDILSF